MPLYLLLFNLFHDGKEPPSENYISSHDIASCVRVTRSDRSKIMNTKQIPAHIEANLVWLIDHEHENPDFGKRIAEISDRYGI
jgi:hypothetical protein